MNAEDINNILTEISKLQKQGITLSDRLSSQKILSDYKIITEQSARGRFTLAREYALVKRNYNVGLMSFFGNDINAFIALFTTVTIIQRKLGRLYEKRREISDK